MIEQKIVNRQGVILKCKIFNNEKNKCILFIPGLAQSFEGFVQNLANQSKEYGFDFIYPIVQNSGVVKKFKQIRQDGVETEILRGACFDRIRNSFADIDCLIRFASHKYTQVVVVGYCFGCDKILNYLNLYPNNKIIGLSLIAPQDMFTTIYGKNGNLLVHQAIENIKSGKEGAVIYKKLFSFCDVSSGTYLDMIINKNFYQFPIFSKDINLHNLLDLNIPVQLVIGEKDRGLQNEGVNYMPDEYLYIISKKVKSCENIVIPNATHSFSANSSELVSNILRFASDIYQNQINKGGEL